MSHEITSKEKKKKKTETAKEDKHFRLCTRDLFSFLKETG